MVSTTQFSDVLSTHFKYWQEQVLWKELNCSGKVDFADWDHEFVNLKQTLLMDRTEAYRAAISELLIVESLR